MKIRGIRRPDKNVIINMKTVTEELICQIKKEIQMQKILPIRIKDLEEIQNKQKNKTKNKIKGYIIFCIFVFKTKGFSFIFIIVFIPSLLIVISFVLILAGFLEKNRSNSSTVECGFRNTTFSMGFMSVQFIFILIIFVLFDVELILLLRIII